MPVEGDTDELDCQVCGKSFDSLRLLNMHVLSHGSMSSESSQGTSSTGVERSEPLIETVHADFLLGGNEVSGVIDESSNSSHLSASFNDKSRELRKRNQSFSDAGPIQFLDENISQSPSKISKNERHICPVCNKVFFNTRNFERHMLSHNAERNYSCPNCSKTYKYKWDLNRHFERKHMNWQPNRPVVAETFTCNVCKKQFSGMSVYEKHCQLSKCGEVLASLSDDDSDQEGSASFETSKPCICKICDAKYVNKLLLKQHRLSHIKKIPCSVCGRSFYRQSDFQNHRCSGEDAYGGSSEDEENSVSGFTCGICHANFQSENAYQRHCAESCNVQYNTANSGNSSQNARPNEDLPVAPAGNFPDPCRICGKVFATVSNLKRHMMSHSKVRNYKCTECHKSYIYKWDLTNHMKRAHLESSQIIEAPPSKRNQHMDFNMIDSDSLRRSRSASSNSSLTCKHCGGVFQGQNTLHAHLILRHSGVIDDANDITNELMHYVEHYTCKICGRSFSDKRLYKSHVASHSQKEVYCNGCRAELLTDGIDLPSDEEVEFLCDVCDGERRSQEEAAGLI